MGVVNYHQALAAIPIQTLMLFMFVDPVRGAIQKTGVGLLLSNAILFLCGSSQTFFPVVLYLLVGGMTQIIDNTATCCIFLTSVATISVNLGLPLKVMLVGLVAAASASFMAPVGAPFNYLIHKAGDYNYFTWIRACWVLQVIHFSCSMGFIYSFLYIAGGLDPDPLASGALLEGGAGASGQSGDKVAQAL